MSLGGAADSGLVIAGNGAKGDIDPVGAIDSNDRERELNQFFLAELRSRKRKHVVWDIALSKQRQGFRPSERGALALGIKGAFLPGAKKINPLLGFPGGTQLFGVHAHAPGAVVDL